MSVLIVFLVGCKESPQKRETPIRITTVQVMESPAGVNSSLPYLIANADKTLMSWVEKEGDTLTKLKYAELSNGKWQQPQDILQGDDWFVNWADFPMIAENRGNLWSHVLKKSTVGTYSYDVKMNVRAAGENHWSTNMSLHTDDTPTEHGFVSVLPYEDAFFVTWLDGRNTEENEVGERGAMTLRAAKVAVNGVVSEENELDERTCDCCQTTAVITDNGPVVFYRDRSEEEVRDISVVRQVNGKWTASKTLHQDNWKIKGCPVNGPKATSLGNSLAVAWFTGAQENPRIQLIFSTDAGESFDTPIQIATENPLGRVDVVLVDANTAIVSWMDAKNKQGQLKAIKVSRSGKLSDFRLIATLSASRKTGFPQMELVDDTVYFAWTDVNNNTSTIKTTYIQVTEF